MRNLLLFFSILVISCSSPTQKEPVTIYCNSHSNVPIEILNLKKRNSIKNSDGKLVQLEGYFSFNFEDVAIYPSKGWNSEDALWLDLVLPDSLTSMMLDSLNKKKIQVIGRINTQSKGHMGEYLGTLDSVYCMKVYK